MRTSMDKKMWRRVRSRLWLLLMVALLSTLGGILTAPASAQGLRATSSETAAGEQCCLLPTVAQLRTNDNLMNGPESVQEIKAKTFCANPGPEPKPGPLPKVTRRPCQEAQDKYLAQQENVRIAWTLVVAACVA